MSKLHALISEWVEVQETLGRKALAARADPSLRGDVIALRRRFSETLHSITVEIECDEQLKADPRLAKEFRERFTETRRRIAIFQTKWPAVLLDQSGSEFIDEGNILNAGNRLFSTWALATLRAGLIQGSRQARAC